MAFKSYSQNLKKKVIKWFLRKSWKLQEVGEQEPQDEVVPIAAVPIKTSTTLKEPLKTLEIEKAGEFRPQRMQEVMQNLAKCRQLGHGKKLGNSFQEVWDVNICCRRDQKETPTPQKQERTKSLKFDVWIPPQNWPIFKSTNMLSNWRWNEMNVLLNRKPAVKHNTNL